MILLVGLFLVAVDNGYDDYITISNKNWFTNEFSICFFAQIESDAGGAIVSKYSWNENNTPISGLGFAIGTNNKLIDGAGIGRTVNIASLYNEYYDSTKSSFPRFDVNTSDFVFISGIYDNGLMKLYINGELVDSRTKMHTSNCLENPYDIMIGTYFHDNGKFPVIEPEHHNVFHGKVDELRIYNK